MCVRIVGVSDPAVFCTIVCRTDKTAGWRRAYTRCGAENNEKPTPRGRCDAYVKNMTAVLRKKIRPAGAQDGFALIF